MPAVGEYVIPELLGGPAAQTVGRALWNEFFANHDWPMAAALANALLVGLLLPLGPVAGGTAADCSICCTSRAHVV